MRPAGGAGPANPWVQLKLVNRLEQQCCPAPAPPPAPRCSSPTCSSVCIWVSASMTSSERPGWTVGAKVAAAS